MAMADRWFFVLISFERDAIGETTINRWPLKQVRLYFHYGSFIYLFDLRKLPTIVNHLKVERISFIEVCEVTHGNDKTQL